MTSSAGTTWLKAVLASLGVLCISVMPASSHPHVFIEATADFKFDQAGDLNAIGISWAYDAFTSLTLIALLDLDSDNDQILSDADRARIVEAQTIWPDDFAGDTYLEAGGQAVAFAKPMNGAAQMQDGRIIVSFDLPLQVPLSVHEPVELRLYDPTYYYSYVTADVTSANECDTVIRSFEPSSATSGLQAQLVQLSREETPEQEDVGRLFADVVTLTCN